MGFQEKTDVTASLTDLERKLVDLERELASITAIPAPRAPEPAPPEREDPQAVGQRVDGLRDEIAGLVRFRDQLEAAADQLVAEYTRLVERLQASAGAQAPGQERFEGAVTVDAGPFPDDSLLDVFTSALAHVEGAEDVFVQSYEGQRAELTVRLASPVDLTRRLQDLLGLPVTATAATDRRLTVDLAAGPDGA